jgi:Domain of unknown function (DU1801)
MKSNATTVKGYLESLPAERREAIETVRRVILDNLPKGYEESMSLGMLAYSVPLSRLPDTYNGQPLWYAALASQKNYMAVYLMTVYGDKKMEQWFRSRYKACGKKLDMGRSCIRFRKVDDLPLDLIGEAIAKVPLDAWVERYKQSRQKQAAGSKRAGS